jgi:ABC-type taurine transport system ATPase subunit
LDAHIEHKACERFSIGRELGSTGRSLDGCSANIGIVFQSFALFPWLTVQENVEVPLVARGLPHSDRHRQASQALAMVGLKGFENAYPKELSGGMKQRVGFARALAVNPVFTLIPSRSATRRTPNPSACHFLADLTSTWDSPAT